MRVNRPMVGIVVASAVLAAATAASALESPGGGTANPPYTNGPASPRVLVIGDSISQGQEQDDNYAYLNAAAGWGTEVRATGGYTISDHLTTDAAHKKSNTFKYASTNGNVRAVFVELGTNDMAKITTEAQRGQVWAAVQNAVAALPNKCIVWLGLNTQFNSYVSQENAADFNQFVWSRSKEHNATFTNVHFGDYNHLVETNADVRQALQADSNKVHFVGDHAPAARTALAVYEQSLIDRYCL